MVAYLFDNCHHMAAHHHGSAAIADQLSPGVVEIEHGQYLGHPGRHDVRRHPAQSPRIGEQLPPDEPLGQPRPSGSTRPADRRRQRHHGGLRHCTHRATLGTAGPSGVGYAGHVTTGDRRRARRLARYQAAHSRTAAEPSVPGPGDPPARCRRERRHRAGLRACRVRQERAARRVGARRGASCGMAVVGRRRQRPDPVPPARPGRRRSRRSRTRVLCLLNPIPAGHARLLLAPPRGPEQLGLLS